jgi:predicted  nucleic acid-binding Zn-ribbon protein
MNPMILSDKVAEMIKDLEVEVGIKEVALNSAMRRINELKNQVEELLIENDELRETIRDYGNR